MQKIITQKEKDKVSHRNQLIIGLILILLMVLSTAGYALTGGEREKNNQKKIDYKGVSFIQESEYWSFNLEGYSFITLYNPQETEDIFFLDTLGLQDYSNKPLYFVGKGEAVYELSRNLNQFVLRMQEACLANENCSVDLPVKDCSTDNVIVIKEPLKNENNRILKEDNCVYIISSLENQTRYADAFLFKALGL